MSDTKTGQCLCGSIKITATADMEHFGACHCAMCRKWSGGPFMEVQCDDGIEIGGEENVAIYNSSEWAERGFCKNCGTHLFYRVKGNPKHYVSIGLFADSIDPVLTEQVFIDRKPSGYSFEQKTKNYTEQEIFDMFAVD